MSAVVAINIISVILCIMQQVVCNIISGGSSSCNNCCTGAAGLNGVPGVPGNPGGFGPPGPVGPKGDAGASIKGDKGDAGDKGLPGSQEMLGSPGKDGSTQQFSGFTVVKTSPQSTEGIVTFHEVITNAGGHFDTNTNKFTCQIPGYYLFTFSVGAEGTNGPNVQLKKNEATVVNAYTHPSGSTLYYRNMGTNSALLQLAAGDEVWLHNKLPGITREINAAPTWRWTAFSGVLLHET